MGGYYLSRAFEVINDRVSVVYSDFQMDWDDDSDQAEVLSYCAMLEDFLYENLSEEEILICAYPVSHLGNKPPTSTANSHLLTNFYPHLTHSAAGTLRILSG